MPQATEQRNWKPLFPGGGTHLDDQSIIKTQGTSTPPIVRPPVGTNVQVVRGTDAPSPPPKRGKTDDRSATEVMQDQAANVLKGIPQAVTGIPSALVGAGHAVSDLFGRGDPRTALNMVQGAVQPLTTTARGAAALAAPNSVQAPSQQDWEQAAQGAGGALGSSLLGAALQSLHEATQFLKSKASMAPSTTLDAHAVSDPGTALMRTGRFRAEATPLGDQQLLESKPIEQPEASNPQGQKQIGAGKPVEITSSEKVTPKPPQRAVSGIPQRQSLYSGPGKALPVGTDAIPIEADSSLPKHYADTPATSPAAGPATMGKINLGEEGGIPAHGEQTVTGQRVHMAVRDEATGKFRKLTPDEKTSFMDQFSAQKGTVGRTAVEAPAPPPKPAGKPNVKVPTKGKQ